mgnify:FL=1
MKRILRFVGFLFCFYLGIDALIMGETQGFSARGTDRMINFESNPIEYILMILFCFVFGVYLLKIALFNKDD